MCLLAAVASFSIPVRTRKTREIAFLFAAIAMLTALGFAFSLVPVSERLTMLALHRSTGLVAFVLYALAVLAVARLANTRLRSMLIVVLAAFLSICGVGRLLARSGAVTRCYLDAQLWAEKNTPRQAMFFPPLDKFYGSGWSEYSRRASFGSPRDWLHISLCYVNSLESFREGVRRLALFGVKADDLRSWYGDRGNDAVDLIQEDFRRAVNGLTCDQWRGIAEREGIDYVVFHKECQAIPDGLPRIYENAEYAICRVGEEK